MKEILSRIDITKLFPVILIALNICAAIVSFIGKDPKKGLYWLFAAGLNICVTF